jgi:hypothetical protein
MATRPRQLLPEDLDLDALKAAPGAAARPAFLNEPSAEPVTAPPIPEPPQKNSVGLKEKAVATTLYLLPDDHLRLRTMALRRNVSFQTLVLDALDLLLEREGEEGVARWETRRKIRPL